jgi:hypothetical protein
LHTMRPAFKKPTAVPVPDAPDKYWSVYYTKDHKKKNKVYRDGILIWSRGQKAILFDSDGKKVFIRTQNPIPH